MAYQMSPAEKEYLKDLEENFEKHVQEYLEQKTRELENEGGYEKLKGERNRLQQYVDGVGAGMISEVMIKARFENAKLHVLNELLDADMSKTLPAKEEYQLTREQLKILAKEVAYMYGHDGKVRDTIGFSHRILSTLKNAEGKRINKITIYVSEDGAETNCAFFNDHNARLNGKNTRKCTLTQDLEGKVHITCVPPLSVENHHRCVQTLAKHLTHYK